MKPIKISGTKDITRVELDLGYNQVVIHYYSHMTRYTYKRDIKRKNGVNVRLVHSTSHPN